MLKKSVVKRFIDLGLNVMPATSDKRPSLSSWKHLQESMVIPSDWEAPKVAMICGKISNNLEVIDLDQKYYSGNLLKELGMMVQIHNEPLWNKLVIQETVGGGWHIIYRSEQIGGNQKIAQRKATPEEQKIGEKVKVLIETRGEGGYVIVQPSEGYRMIQNKLSNIPILSKAERNLLFSLCKSFDDCGQLERSYGAEGITPWDDYDKNHTCREVLEKNGWGFVYSDSKRDHYKRPGDTESKTSGNVLVESQIFRCFSTSTEFDSERFYGPSGILCILEYGGDWHKCGSALKRAGYGTKEEDTTEVSSFLVSAASINKLSEDFYDGKIPPPRSLGIDALNYWLPIRYNSFYMFVGGKGVGKTTLVLYLLAQDAWINGTKTLVRSFENDAMELQDEVINFITGYSAKWVYKNQRMKYDRVRDWFHEHFKIMKTPPHYNFFDIIKVAEQLQGVDRCDQLWIDPLFKVAETDKYENNKKIAAYAEPFANDVMSLFISMHPNSSTQRGGGQPKDLDAEFGGLYSNAADFTISLQRNNDDQSEDVRSTVNLVIGKVRSMKLYGGHETYKDCPIKFEYLWKKGGYRIFVPDPKTTQYQMFEREFFKSQL